MSQTPPPSEPSSENLPAAEPPQPDAERTGDTPLRRDVRMLGFELGHVLRQHGGEGIYQLVEEVRALSKARRAGDGRADQNLRTKLAGLSEDQLGDLIRALACFFDLANLAEDRHRIRVLRQRERERHPEARAQSIGDAIQTLAAEGRDAGQIQGLLDQLDIDLVFTAHPTEAKRRTVRNTLRRLRQDLIELDREAGHQTPRLREHRLGRIKADLACLWETDMLRPRKPSVIEEAKRALFVADSIWAVVPWLYRDLETSLARAYPGQDFKLPRFIRFGSWIGGDRDGNPFVTAEVTRRALGLLRSRALEKHLAQCEEIRAMLSISDRRHPVGPEFDQRIHQARQRWPEVDQRLAALNPGEKYRHLLAIIRYRLEQTALADPLGESPDAAYPSAQGLADDLGFLDQTLRQRGLTELADGELADWRYRLSVFGFHLARLDIREDSTRLHASITELAKAAGLSDDYAALDEDARQAMLAAAIDPAAAERLNAQTLTDQTRETLDLFLLLERVARQAGVASLGCLVVSMTHHPSDLLAMLWLGRLAAARLGHEEPAATLPIVPLFEKIDDLKNAGQTLTTLMSWEPYAHRVHEHGGGRQVCMVGYSDSAKDGGYLASNWGLYHAQSELVKTARELGVELLLFHGRGGALGRGGGPAARSVLSLPPDSVDHRIRITEQGEVLAERYDDPEIALRHLEQVTWATILVSAAPRDPLPELWARAMGVASEASMKAYRALLADPGFIDYFQHATPIASIESLPIGSRPARRGAKRDLSNLRAIPYTFAWTQNRHMITAFFGLGSGLHAAVEAGEPGVDWDTFAQMYRDWPAFAATMDNAELALAKCDPEIGRAYAELVPDQEAGLRLWRTVRDEYERSRAALLRITGRTTLLQDTPWLQRSIRVRNPYVDPLNFIQIELMRRLSEAEDPAQRERLDELLRLSVQGIAAGLRNTG